MASKVLRTQLRELQQTFNLATGGNALPSQPAGRRSSASSKSSRRRKDSGKQGTKQKNKKNFKHVSTEDLVVAYEKERAQQLRHNLRVLSQDPSSERARKTEARMEKIMKYLARR